MKRSFAAAFVFAASAALSGSFAIAGNVITLPCDKSSCSWEGDNGGQKSRAEFYIYPRCVSPSKPYTYADMKTHVTQCSTPNVWVKGQLTANDTDHPECLFNKSQQAAKFTMKVEWQCPGN